MAGFKGDPADPKLTVDAVRRAIVIASELPDVQVIWKAQNVDAPLEDYVTLKIRGRRTIGIDYLDTQTNPDPSPPAGQDLRRAVRGTREAELELECFTKSTAEEDDAATNLAEKIKTGLVLPSVRRIFRSVGVSPFDPGPSSFMPDIPSVGFRGRAVCTIRCYMPAPLIAEYVSRIERVAGTVTISGGNPDPEVISYSKP